MEVDRHRSTNDNSHTQNLRGHMCVGYPRLPEGRCAVDSSVTAGDRTRMHVHKVCVSLPQTDMVRGQEFNLT